jgi:Domain of unknown function (DUF4262)
MTGMQTDYERDIVRFVESHGCFVVNVVPDENGDQVPFSYSIGFTKSLAQPEVVLVGLAPDSAHPLINDLYELCRRGLKLSDGVRIDELVRDRPCFARSVDDSWLIQSYFASALWFHRTQMGSSLRSVVQVVWPDPDGFFPWEKECADWARSDQLAMHLPRLAA